MGSPERRGGAIAEQPNQRPSSAELLRDAWKQAREAPEPRRRASPTPTDDGSDDLPEAPPEESGAVLAPPRPVPPWTPIRVAHSPRRTGKLPKLLVFLVVVTALGAASTMAQLLAPSDPPEVAYAEGLVLMDQGRYREAGEAFSEVIDSETDDLELLADAFIGRSLANSSRGRYDQAVADVSAAIDLEQGDAEALAMAYAIRADVYGSMERDNEAVADATTAIDLGPDDVDLLARSYIIRSRALGFLDRSSEALDDAVAAISLAPELDVAADAELARSIALFELGWLGESFQAATAVVQLEPEDTDTLALGYLYRGIAMYGLGRSGEALDDYGAVIDLGPPDAVTVARAHILRALALMELDRIDEAAVDLRTVFEILPEGDALYETATNLLADLGLTET